MSEIFKDRFNKLYEESGLSQEDFGKKFNASKSQVFHWRNGSGEPDTVSLVAIANSCNVSVDWLVGKSNVRTPISTIAAHRTDDPTKELPEEAQKSLEDFKKFLFEKHGLKYD